MQYLLTEEEYRDLQDGIRREQDRLQEILGDLCKRVACNEPLDLKAQPWDNADWIAGLNGKPWGCIYVKEHDSGYCDKCPVQNVCPLPKDYSK